MPIKVKNRVNYIALYTKKINEGKIIASDKVIRFYNMLKDMLDAKEVFYNDRKAKKAGLRINSGNAQAYIGVIGYIVCINPIFGVYIWICS